MYLIYADESGDTGLGKGGTEHFIISGVILHESVWNTVFQNIVDFRRSLKNTYGIVPRIELHGTDIVTGKKDFHHTQSGLSSVQRFQLYRDALRFLASQQGLIHILNICVRKDRILKKDLDLFDFAWTLFIQRFHNTIDTRGCLARDLNTGFLLPIKHRTINCVS